MIDEVLVHISTPATRQNDDLYLSLADAYLEFEPHNTIGYESQQELRSDGTSPRSLQKSEAAMSAVIQRSDPARSSIVSTSKDSYGSFPSLLSSDGSINNLRDDNTRRGPALVEDDSVPTSSRLARLDRIHQHWKQHATPKSSFIGEPTSSGRTPKLPFELAGTTFTDTTFIEDTQLGAQALQSQLQDDYSLTSDDTSDDEAESTSLELQRPQVPPRDAIRRLPNDTNDRTVPSSRERSTAAVATISTGQSQPAGTTNIVEPSSPVLKSSSEMPKLLNEEGNSTDIYNFDNLPVDVLPPPPKISIVCPGRLPSQVTKHLAAIKAQNPKRFKPIRKHGIPGVDDRGYWLVPCSKWPSKTQHEFWSSMSEHVLSGRLGWGVTLHRDGSSSSLGSVRLYCWAELIEHTWLLLWLCSRGKMAKSGSKWIDAGGNIVYEVQ
ncbi:hypothetical protein DE146DRAFT_367706 [Phaeosphaeria sp. MPI-PUGE-AT-0046c]|nr:hypothetical protein DE146DRAFT_367706 [Phaeosphaeria sp. MPI-PUGE-AT-0046c]